jgi:asparagine N-glycosylation enzyme membrane subunit Stt3
MKITEFLTKNWWLFALVIIFIFAFYIRSVNIVPDRILSFDPVFQYRFTKYFVDWGHFPLWDELTYFVGRVVTPEVNPPLMMYATAALYWLQPFGWSLLTLCSYASALYGALIAIAGFLLVRELSNEYGGLMAAALIGTAPQILIRTFGSSYDTDQFALLFLLLTLFLWLYASRKKTIAAVSLAIAGFVSYMLAWQTSGFALLIVFAFMFFYVILEIMIKKGFFKMIRLESVHDFRDVKKDLMIYISIFLSVVAVGFATGSNFINSVIALMGFALSPETKIVNISIAELQPFSIFNLQGWMVATGNFVSGMTIIDDLIFIMFIVFLGVSVAANYYKKNMKQFSFVLVLMLITVYTTFRGIRFTEFSSALFLVLIAAGFGYAVEFSKNSKFFKPTIIGVGIFIAFMAMFIGSGVGKSLGPDISPNWESAWAFLQTQTPELSLVGTWWDPGHMITGTAQRRVIADGAHCGNDWCLYGINDRITDLGKIMATSDENESVQLIRKYQGDSPKVYWIASDDLIGKYQWLQYFGTGCDARVDSNCPLYMQIAESSRSFDASGNVALRYYNLGTQSQILLYSASIPIPIYIQGINAALFDEVIAYNGTQAIPIRFSAEEKNSIITALQPLEKELNVRFTNQSIPMTVWTSSGFSYIVVIPPNLRQTVFTKMFLLEGEGLNNFKQVFRNDQVKIYEVVENQ